MFTYRYIVNDDRQGRDSLSVRFLLYSDRQVWSNYPQAVHCSSSKVHIHLICILIIHICKLCQKNRLNTTNCNLLFKLWTMVRQMVMGRLCTPGGAVLRIVGGGVTFRFLNGEAILDKNMLFWVRLYALVVVLKILLDFRL